jgi:hypothetical protein
LYSEWSQPFAHLDPGAPADHKLILRFREGTVRNERLSADGPSVYDRVLQVQVHAIGQKNSAPIYTLVKITEGKEKIEEPREYQRFRQTFDQWRANIEPTHDGMPLEHWPLMTVELVRAFKDANIFSVEQLADAPDAAANNVRAPFYDFRAKAKAWLSEAKTKGGDAKARSELAKAQREIDELRQQVSQLLAVQNGASPKATGFDKPKRKKNGAAEDAPISIPDDAMEEFEDRI